MEDLTGTNLAPIVVFAYNRPWHLRKTLKALMANRFAKHSRLIVYADGAKPSATQTELEKIEGVRDYLTLLALANKTEGFFHSIDIVQRECNFGLADSIINGVSEVMQKYGMAIVLEDDIITSPVFLDYMNASLHKYQHEARVWSISAWSYPINPQNLGDCFFWRSPHCWGWASWADRWQYFKRDIPWALENFSQEDIDYININGSARYYDQVIANYEGRIKTWAIFNYLIAYKHGALSLCPNVSYIRQIGFDNSGEHCGEDGEILNTQVINTTFPVSFPSEVVESRLAFERIEAFELAQKLPIAQRIVRKIQRIQTTLHQRLVYVMTGKIGGGATLNS